MVKLHDILVAILEELMEEVMVKTKVEGDKDVRGGDERSQHLGLTLIPS